MNKNHGDGGGPRAFGDLFPRDDQGRRIIGDPKLGCRHCGLVVRSAVTDYPHIIVYHPGAECCAPALLDAIGKVNAALTSYRQQVDIEGAQVAAVKPKILDALKERTRLQTKLRGREEH